MRARERDTHTHTHDELSSRRKLFLRARKRERERERERRRRLSSRRRSAVESNARASGCKNFKYLGTYLLTDLVIRQSSLSIFFTEMADRCNETPESSSKKSHTAHTPQRERERERERERVLLD